MNLTREFSSRLTGNVRHVRRTDADHGELYTYLSERQIATASKEPNTKSPKVLREKDEKRTWAPSKDQCKKSARDRVSIPRLRQLKAKCDREGQYIVDQEVEVKEKLQLRLAERLATVRGTLVKLPVEMDNILPLRKVPTLANICS